jgi:hypothetical protein
MFCVKMKKTTRSTMTDHKAEDIEDTKTPRLSDTETREKIRKTINMEHVHGGTVPT